MLNNDSKPIGPAWKHCDDICPNPLVEWFNKGDTITVMAEGFDAPLRMRVFCAGNVVLAKRTIKGIVHIFDGPTTGMLHNYIDSAKPWRLVDTLESIRRPARKMTQQQLDDVDAQVVEVITEYFENARVRYEAAQPEGNREFIPEAYGVPYPDAGLIVNELTCNRGMIHGAHFAGDIKAKQAAVRRSIARLMKRGIVKKWTDENALYIVELQRRFENQ